MSILKKVKEVRESSKKRNFNQRFDLIINLRGLDLKKTEERIDEIFKLPHGSGKKSRITLFSDEVKEVKSCRVINSSEMEKIVGDKKSIKKLISETDFFLSEPRLMPVVGRHLGRFLAPKGLMPKPVVGDLGKAVKDRQDGVKILVKKQPVIQVPVGSEDMKDKDIADNVKAVLDFLKSKLPRDKENLKSVHLKLTMGKPIKLEVD